MTSLCYLVVINEVWIEWLLMLVVGTDKLTGFHWSSWTLC